MDAIAPPYTPEFVQLVLPMVENEEITGTMRAEGENDPVSEFIGQSHNHYNNFVQCIFVIVICMYMFVTFSHQNIPQFQPLGSELRAKIWRWVYFMQH